MSILLVLLFFGLLLVLWTRDLFRFLVESRRGYDSLAGLSGFGVAGRVAMEGKPELPPLARISPVYLVFILGLAAVLAGSTYAVTGDRVQPLFLGAAFLTLGLWRKLRLAIMLRLSGKWLPPPPGGFSSDEDRAGWESRQSDLAPKALLRAALFIFASDMLLVGVVLAAGLALRGPG